MALTLAGLVTLYQVFFDVWMTAYPFANTKEWQTRLYIRLVTAIAIGVFWGLLAGWLYRQHRNRMRIKRDVQLRNSRAECEHLRSWTYHRQ